MSDVILHTFNWRYQEIIDRVESIREAGYGAILIPPPLYSDPNNAEWWQRYQPKDYRLLLSALGGKQQLETLIEQCHSREPRLQVYADIIINHMANENRADRLNFPGETELQRYRDNPDLFAENRLYGDLSQELFSPADFNQSGDITDWTDRYQVQYYDLSGLPDLRDTQRVYTQQREMLAALVEMGFDGFRIDAIKHMSEGMIDNFADRDFMADKYLFGEVFTGNDQEEEIFLDPFLVETWMPAYDFPLFQTIREAFSVGGSLASLANPEAEGNALPSSRSVTFAVNHDIPYNDTFRYLLLDRQDETLAYVYILGRNEGIPLLLCDRNESAENHPEDRDRWANMIEREDVRRGIQFRNAVAEQPMEILYASDLVLVFSRGNLGIVAINKGSTETSVEFDTSGLNNPGKYQDLIHDYQMQLSGDRFSLYIPPRTAQMWLSIQ